MFIRFVAGADRENGWWLTGIITTSRLLRDAGELHDYEGAWLDELFAWFNENLPCPPFRQMLAARLWTHDAVSWFRSDAGEAVSRMWDLVALLREHEVPIRLLTERDPGRIVYEDAYQVVAETPLEA